MDLTNVDRLSGMRAPLPSSPGALTRAGTVEQVVGAVRTFASASVNRRIFVSMILVAGATGVVKLASIAKEMMIAGRFGAGDQIDAFVIAFALPTFVVGVVSAGVQATVIPAYIQIRERDGQRVAGQLVSTVTLLGACLLLALTIILGLLGPTVLPLIASGFDRNKLLLTERLFFLLLPLVVLAGFTGIWGAVLNAEERFLLVGAAPVATPVLVAFLLWIGGSHVSVSVLPAGMLIGAVVEAVVLACALRRRRLWHVRRRHGPSIRVLTNGLMKQFLASAAGALLMSTTTVVDQAMAAMLQPGSVALLNYGNRLVLFLLGLVSGALSTACLPQFASLVARADWAAVRHTLRTYLRWIACAAVPATAALVWLSVPITRLMFERGAFDHATTRAVSAIQVMYLIQVPFYLMSMLLVRLISALRANHVLMWGSAINVVVNVVLDIVFIRWIGVKGIALSTTVVYVVSFAFLGIVLVRRLRAIEAQTG